MSDNMMWALVKEKPEAGLWMKRVPIPEVGPNDVKIDPAPAGTKDCIVTTGAPPPPDLYESSRK